MSAEKSRDRGALPEVSDETLAGIEDRVFRIIADERASRSTGARRRRRLWSGLGIAAAIVVVGAVVSPAVLQGIGGVTSAGGSAAESAPMPPGRGDTAQDADGGGAVEAPAAEDADGDVDLFRSGQELSADRDREIVRTGSASVVVDDAAAAAEEITQLAAAHDGWVEQLSIGADQSFDPAKETVDTVWVPDDGGFVSIRVPSAELDPFMDALDDVGEVASSRVGTQDVTSQAVDLRARIDAARASVDRLTELLEESGSVGDLVQVESTLSQRQSELESLERQLESLEGQVAMSTLSVSLLREPPPVEPDPAGFGDGLETGWNGLLAVLNGLVIALGFVLPWAAVLAVAWLVVWGVLRFLHRRDAEHRVE
ncbi:DUF4349 domain-containing protein [Microbacterium rhizophilus]|uniref:DUF4349 domain-containing protein n=1 Tax=Microbacterium rhizophilus TaxID=3138934 RepID=UPI0031E5AF9F